MGRSERAIEIARGAMRLKPSDCGLQANLALAYCRPFLLLASILLSAGVPYVTATQKSKSLAQITCALVPECRAARGTFLAVRRSARPVPATVGSVGAG
jgi:hypothetical protein